MRARLRGSLAARRACSPRRRPCGLRGKAATRFRSEGDMLEWMCPDVGAPNVWGTRAGALRQFHVNGIPGKWGEAGRARLAGPDPRLDRPPADRRVRGATGLVARGARLRDGVRIRAARVPEAL